MASAAGVAAALAEAKEEYKKAEAAVKTSLLKWSADYTVGSSAFGRAGDAFARAGDVAAAVDAYEKCADASKKDSRPLGAAMALDKAAKLLERSADKSISKIATLYDGVCEAFVGSGDTTRGADAKMRAGDVLVALDPSQAEVRYMEAIDLYAAKAGKAVYAVKPLKEAVGKLVAAGRHRAAMDVYDRLGRLYTELAQYHNVHGVILSRIVLLLVAGDAVSARREYEKGFGVQDFTSSREAEAAEDLLLAWESMNNAQVEAVTKTQVFTFLDRHITTLARTLRPAEMDDEDDGDAAPAAGSKAGGKPAAAAAAASSKKPVLVRGEMATDSASIKADASRTVEIEGLGRVTISELGGRAGAGGDDDVAGDDDGAAGGKRAKERSEESARAALFAGAGSGGGRSSSSKKGGRRDDDDDDDDDGDAGGSGAGGGGSGGDDDGAPPVHDEEVAEDLL